MARLDGGMGLGGPGGYCWPFPARLQSELPGNIFSDGYAVPGGEGEKVVPVYPVLPSGETERCQVALLDPAQYGYFTNATVPGDDAGGEIFRVCSGNGYSQVWPPFRPRSSARMHMHWTGCHVSEVVNAVHLANRFYENTLTYFNSGWLHLNHKKRPACYKIITFNETIGYSYVMVAGANLTPGIPSG